MLHFRRMDKDRLLLAGVLSAVFAFFAYIMYCAPLTSDDFFFGRFADLGFADTIRFVLHYGNGRIAGNLLTMLLVKHPVLPVVVKPAMILFLIFLIAKLFYGDKNLSAIVLALLLIVGMSPDLFAQVLTWTSGFSVYTVSVLCTLLCVRMVLSQPEAERIRPAGYMLRLTGLFVIGFWGQLYVEHVSIVNLLLSAAATVYFWQTRKHVQRTLSLMWLVSAILGAAAMYFIPHMFYEPGNFVEHYGRALQMDSFSEAWQSFYRNLLGLSSMFVENIVLLVVLSVLGFAVLRITKERWKNPKLNLASQWVCVGFLSFVFVNTALCKNIWFGRFTAERLALIVLLTVGFFVVFLLAVWHIPQKRTRMIAIACVITAAMSVAPLLFVTPTVNRCLFFAYCCLSAAAIVCFRWLRGVIAAPLANGAEMLIGAFAVVLAVCLAGLFTNIHDLWLQQQADIAAEMSQGAAAVVVDRCPHEYVYENRTAWSHKYRYYYHEVGDIAFSFSGETLD